MNKLSKFLLASTCLTTVSVAPAQALTVAEIEPNNTLPTAQLLAPGTTQVTAALQFSDDFDGFKLTGLQGGASFTAFISAVSPPPGSLTEQTFIAWRSNLTPIVFQTSVANGTTLSNTIPNDGILFLSVDGCCEGTDYAYTLNINAPAAAPQVPEPSVLNLMASGAAGLTALSALWRKRQSR